MSEQRYPEPTVGALIVDSQNRFFFMRSHKWGGRWVIPGGHVELGETLEEALRREIKEETNLEIRDVEFIHFQEFVYGATFWKKRHFLFFDYACRVSSSDVKLNEEAQEYAWVSVEEARGLDLESYTRKTLETYVGSQLSVAGSQSKN